jgi:spore germination protein YaaH
MEPKQIPNPSNLNNNLPENPENPSTSSGREKMWLIEKLLELDLGIHMAVGALVLFIGIFIIAWRLDLVGIFAKSSQPPLVATNPTTVVKPNRAIIASDKTPVFINTQKVDIDKAFKGELPKAKLTIAGPLKREVFGFLPYWIIEKADQIDTRLLTSVSYFGLEVDSRGNIVKSGEGGVGDAWATWESNAKLDDFIKKAKRQKIKVYVTLKNFSNGNIEALVNSPESVTNFINNALYLVNSKSLDGINIDFEYVGTPTEKVRDNFSLMVDKLNKELKRQYPKSHLSVCTYIDAASETRLYDVTLLSRYADSLVIMGYDFHTPNSSVAGPVAPMESAGISITGFMASYLEKVSSTKLILAVPYYGYDWPVDSSGQVISGGEARAYPYGEITANTKTTQIQWDENAKTPWYSYSENGQRRVVYFENTRSLGIKYDFINQKNLEGVGIWALGFDGNQTDLWQLIADKFAKK